MAVKKKRAPLVTVGWQEFAELPTLTSLPIRAKVDTGAASCSIHASKVVTAHDGFGRPIASFDLHLSEDRSETIRFPRYLIKGSRSVRSSSGHWEIRPVIRVPLTLGGITFETDVTLASRDPMEYRMLIGRGALAKRFCVDPSKSFLLGDHQ